MKKIITAFVLSFLLILGGCATMDPNSGQHERQGEVVGAVILGLVGAAVGDAVDCHGCAAAFGATGAILGSQLGRAIGKNMDDTDRLRQQLALEKARTNTAVAWQNPDSGTRYQVTPTRTYQAQGTYCREFILNETQIGGEPQQMYGTACRQPDGSWKLQ